jgi:chromosomal replication initiation ATPase DnaA
MSGPRNARAQQLVFDLPHRSALGLEDFMVSASNEAAVRVIDSWPRWPHPSMVLVGPEGSGKTHLANVWCQAAGAETVSAAELSDGKALTEARTIVVEDADRGIGSETALFHLMNLAREHGGNLLITGRTPPGDWTITLPDLRSRLRACPAIPLGEPDEHLLGMVLVKLLHDRQLPATPAAVAYLSRHLDRSMAAAIAVVAAIDKLLWDKPSEITRDVARRALAAIGKTDAGEA